MRPGLTYPFTTARPKDGPMFRSSCMEEKWDVTWLSPYLYLTRSWTGDLVHKIEIEFADQRMFVSELLSAGDPSLAHDDLLAVRDADFLIKVLLYRWQGPHSMRCSPGDDPMTIAVASFAKFGRQGWFATFAETTGFRVS